MRIIVLTIVILSGCTHSNVANGCNEKEGLVALYSNNEPLAFNLLKGCEADLSASGEALHNLHSLIYSGAYGAYESFGDRIDHSQELACKAALKGYAVSVFLFSSYYEDGEDYLGIYPNMKVSNCLHGLLKDEQKYANPSDVSDCFAHNTELVSINQCY